MNGSASAPSPQIERLASVVFTLLAVSNFETADRPVDILLAAATWTILFSVIAHGLSAVPLSTWYARRLAEAQTQPAEMAELPELYQRRRMLAGSKR